MTSYFVYGEIMMLKRSSPKWHQKRTCEHWGYNWPSEVNDLYTDASNIILSALKSADIIGIMDPQNDIASKIDYSKESWSIDLDYLRDSGVNREFKNITDHMLFRSEAFGRPDNFKSILSGRSLNIITPHVERLENRNLSKLFESDVTFTHHPDNINLNNREEFISGFKNINSDVVLIGCGLQKDYATILRDRHDKIALDVGALLDAWSGIDSRPWFKPGGQQDYLLI